ncbi:MAG: NAD-dependent epimerase/dehydratase family protein [Candidatus Thiodiazotropha sp.]
MNTILVTGANGFVGEHLCRYMLSRGYGVRAVLRQRSPHWQLCEQVAVGDIDGATDWSSALDGVDTVVHLAARVHVMRESNPIPWLRFDESMWKALLRSPAKPLKPVLNA